MVEVDISNKNNAVIDGVQQIINLLANYPIDKRAGETDAHLYQEYTNKIMSASFWVLGNYHDQIEQQAIKKYEQTKEQKDDNYNNLHSSYK